MLLEKTKAHESNGLYPIYLSIALSKINIICFQNLELPILTKYFEEDFLTNLESYWPTKRKKKLTKVNA